MLEQALRFLNENAGALQAVFSGLVMAATVVYALLTWRLASETRQMRRLQVQPEISVTIQPQEENMNFVDMVIENIGLGPAYDLRLETDSDLRWRGTKLVDMGVFQQGIRFFAPRQRLDFFLVNVADDFDKLMSTTVRVKAIFRDQRGERYTRDFALKFSEFQGLRRVGTPPLTRLARSLEQLRNDLYRSATGLQAIRVQIERRPLPDEEEVDERERGTEAKDGSGTQPPGT